ncbi:hypothetical protein MJO55_07365 [Mycolicibacterium rufum]|uniref:CobQ/CobB/MinD/ParA nucleotide binding domain-containing protein n=1 Tax=Mycolicibacterium rufum TaxID=318424 RepID=A0A9X3BTK7_9MYCO|nr:division plane positioning ATPase MipZ [Mycolicibacterium rufum]MCV7073451.1 hypothetical protein [Mycolicibacterium rufum]ULP38237.1 hypothetical protein MJO55_07365 [Mycolicibacterium rufum]
MELLKRGWLVVRRRWHVVMIVVVGALVAVSLVNAAQRTEYTATSELFLRSPDVKTSTSAYQGDLFSRQRAQTYVSMLRSDELARLVIDKLALPESPGELVKRVKGDIVKDTVLITVSVTDDNAQRAANIANTYGAVFGQYIATVENVNNDPNIPALVVTVKAASAETAVRGGQSIWLLTALGAIAALVVSGLLLWFLEKFDTKLRSRQQIENLAHAPVIGSLPPTRSLSSRGVVDTYGEDHVFAEAARRLSVNVDHTARQLGTSRTPAIAIAAVQRSDGKTVVAMAVATALADRGYRVGYIDADRFGTVSSDTQAMATGEISLDGVEFVSLRSDELSLCEKTLRSAINKLAGVSEVILIDGPAFGDAAEAQMIAEVADAALLVVRPGRTSSVGLERLKSTMEVLDTPVIGIVVNHAKETGTLASTYI